MGRSRKVTPELAGFIRKERTKGKICKEIAAILRSRYGVQIRMRNIPRYYKPLEVVIEESKRAYKKRKEKKKEIEYMQTYDLRYHRFRRHMSKYLYQTLHQPQPLVLLSDKLAQCAKKDPKIGLAIHVRSRTLERIIDNQMTNPIRAPPIYEVRPGVYALKKEMT